MADECENPIESTVEKISEKIVIHDHSSSSSDSEKKEKKPESPSLVKEKIYRLFGKEKPVPGVLGGGKGFNWNNTSGGWQSVSMRHDLVTEGKIIVWSVESMWFMSDEIVKRRVEQSDSS